MAIAQARKLTPARLSRARPSNRLRSRQLWIRTILIVLSVSIATALLAADAAAETRPHYGGTLRVMLQSSPDALDLSPSAPSNEYWGLARTLSMLGDTLIIMDAQGRPHSALAIAWQNDSSARHWELTLRRGVRFHDGSPASPAAIAQILGALHPKWTVRASADTLSIDSDAATPSLLAELALPRNLLFKRDKNNLPVGTGPFLVAEWQPGKRLTLAANEDSWAGRPFVDAIEIEFGKSLRDQAIALELDKADVIEAAPQPTGASHSTSSSLPVELFALVFNSTAKAQDPHLREALALAIDRKPIQSVLLKGAGEPAASILPNWMTGYGAVFSTSADQQRARTLLSRSRQPALNLSYDPRDPQAQLIAERIALNDREVGITVQVSLSGPQDFRLMRVVLPSPDPATSLAEASRQLGLPQPAFSAPRSNSLDDLYQAERSLLAGYDVIPLFHLPVASATSPRVRNWQPGEQGTWTGAGGSRNDSSTGSHANPFADAWLADSRPEASAR